MVKSFLFVECQFLLFFFLVIKARNSVYHVKSICNKKGYWKLLKQWTYISTNIWLPIYPVFCKVFGRLYFLAFDLRFLITPLVSSKISYLHINFFTLAKNFFPYFKLQSRSINILLFSDCTQTTCCKKYFAEFSAGTQNNRIWPRSSFSWRQRFNLCKSW